MRGGGICRGSAHLCGCLADLLVFGVQVHLIEERLRLRRHWRPPDAPSAHWTTVASDEETEFEGNTELVRFRAAHFSRGACHA